MQVLKDLPVAVISRAVESPIWCYMRSIEKRSRSYVIHLCGRMNSVPIHIRCRIQTRVNQVDIATIHDPGVCTE